MLTLIAWKFTLCEWACQEVGCTRCARDIWDIVYFCRSAIDFDIMNDCGAKCCVVSGALK